MASSDATRVVYKVHDGVEIDAELLLPAPSDKFKARGHPLIIDIHGGAFMLGSSSMVNRDQVRDCLGRGWVVLVPNHRLCPQVDLLDGPVRDCRDLLAWIYAGGVAAALGPERAAAFPIDLDHVFSFGTSSGGTLALSLGFGVPRPVAGILDFYGPCAFDDPSWTRELPHVLARIPDGLSPEFLAEVFRGPVPTRGGVSLEGQQAGAGAPDFSDPRTAYAQTQIARGTVLQAVCPRANWDEVDPVRNVGAGSGSDNNNNNNNNSKRPPPPFPPTFIVHGAADSMVPARLSRALLGALRRAGVRAEMLEIPGEEHTFAGRMEVGSETWRLQRKGFDFLESLIGAA